MITSYGEGGAKNVHKERFKCPQCGRPRIYNFTLFSFERYPCDGYCEYCDLKFKAIDDDSRCLRCDERVNCFLNYAIITEEKDPYVSPTLSRVRKSHKS
jgi:hypothetical protein